ncbi:hypothetical protein FKM82_012902 [Ascaphus truei]
MSRVRSLGISPHAVTSQGSDVSRENEVGVAADADSGSTPRGEGSINCHCARTGGYQHLTGGTGGHREIPGPHRRDRRVMANQLLNHPPLNEMANGHANFTRATLGELDSEEMLEQMKQLMLENNKLKEAMKQSNQVMKERLEELSAWREKQKEEQGLFEAKFLDAKQRLLDMTSENELLRKQKQNLKEKMEEPSQLKTQVGRLQTEKADLLAIISELQLKLNICSSEDSFVEIRIAEHEVDESLKEGKSDDGQVNQELIAYRTKTFGEEKNSLESEEVTVSRLLHSLREETQKVEKLEEELICANERMAQLEKKATDVSHTETQTEIDLSDQEIQTEFDMDKAKGNGQAAVAFYKEIDTLKMQVQSLSKQLQDTSDKLNEAEQLKKRLQEKCMALDERLSENEVDVDERQKLLFSMKKLELQVESMQSEIKMEQSKTQAEKTRLSSLQETYTKQNWEYAELKRNESEKVPKALVNELLQKLDLSEKALAKKQFQIDEINETVKKYNEALETIGLLRAQIDLYCSDFHAERAARENIHQEKEQLATRLAYMIQENDRLEDEVLGRQSIGQLQRRHGSTRSMDSNQAPYLVQRGAESNEQLPTCPKCGANMPDIDTLQIHVMDCIT